MTHIAPRIHDAETDRILAGWGIHVDGRINPTPPHQPGRALAAQATTNGNVTRIIELLGIVQETARGCLKGNQITTTEKEALENATNKTFEVCLSLVKCDQLPERQQLTLIRNPGSAAATAVEEEIAAHHLRTGAVQHKTTVALIASTVVATAISALYATSLCTNLQVSLPHTPLLVAFAVSSLIPASALTFGLPETDKALQSAQDTVTAVKAHVVNYSKMYTFLTAAMIVGVIGYKAVPKIVDMIDNFRTSSTGGVATPVAVTTECSAGAAPLPPTVAQVALPLNNDEAILIEMGHIAPASPMEQKTSAGQVRHQSLVEQMTQGTIVPSIFALATLTFKGVSKAAAITKTALAIAKNSARGETFFCPV